MTQRSQYSRPPALSVIKQKDKSDYAQVRPGLNTSLSSGTQILAKLWIA